MRCETANLKADRPLENMMRGTNCDVDVPASLSCLSLRMTCGHRAPAVLASGGIRIRVAYELLYRHQIHAGIEQIAGEGTPDVVGGKG